MTRLALLVLFGPALAIAAAVGVTEGDPLASGMAIGLAMPLAAGFVFLPVVKSPRKADPVKVARLERELGLDDRPRSDSERRTRWGGCTDSDCPHEHYTVGGFGDRVCIVSPAMRRAVDLASAMGLHGNARQKFIAAYLQSHESAPRVWAFTETGDIRLVPEGTQEMEF